MLKPALIRAVLLTLLPTLLCPEANALATATTWASIAQLPAAVGDGSVVAAPCHGDTTAQCVYSVGGLNQASNALADVDMFDPAIGKWSAVASLSTGRAQLAAASGPCMSNLSQTCVYAIGGEDSSGTYLDTVEIYSPYSNAWSPGASLPTPYAPSNYRGRAQLAAATGPCFSDSSKTCIYAIGGYNPALYTLSSVEMFSPASGTWVAAAPLFVARNRLAAATAPCQGSIASTCLYAIGGTGTAGFLSSVEMYDPATANAWTTVASLHAQGSSAGMAVAGMAATGAPCLGQPSRQCLYALGGQDSSYNILNAAMMYDPSQNGWAFLPTMVSSRDNFGAASAACPQQGQDSCLFAAGGAGQNYVQAAESFDLGEVLHLLISADNATATFGGQIPGLTFEAAGFTNGDSLASLTAPPVCATSASQKGSGQDSSPSGKYPITCSGAVDPNYLITYVPGSLTVEPAALSITAGSPVMVYGHTLPAIAPSYLGLANGDSRPDVAPTCHTTAQAGSPVGSYGDSCSGASDSNYTISYHPGTLTIGVGSLAIKPIKVSIPYGHIMPSLKWSADFTNGDTAPSLTKQPICTSAVVTLRNGAVTSPTGAYPASCSGATDPNYNISYPKGTVAVTLGRLSIAYTGPVDLTIGTKATFRARLSSSTMGDVGGRRISFTLGAGSSAQTCETKPSSASGLATCAVAKVKQPAGKTGLAVEFAGDKSGSSRDYGPVRLSLHVTTRQVIVAD